MKRIINACAACCIAALSLSACSPSSAPAQKTEPASVETSVTSAETTAADTHADMVLSKEQMLSDYNNMWTAMGESYPFWGVLSRSNPENPHYYDDMIEDYRKQIEDMDLEGDDAMWKFIDIIANSLYDVCGSTGHVGILNPHYFRDFRSTNEKYLSEMPVLQPWVDLGRKPEVNAFYEYYDYLLTLLPDMPPETEEGAEENDEEKSADMEELTESNLAEPNLIAKILSEENRVAYIKVDSFGDEMMEEDLPKIRSFLNEVRDYDHLIIDIQNNSGGNTVYWEEAFVRPNITAPAKYRTLRMMEDNELTRQFYGSTYQDSSISVEDIKNDPKLNCLPEEDMGGMAFAKEISDTMEPEFDEKLFGGKIWVLTGPNVFSSSEAFAVFCKESGFATLVGRTTGGSDSGGPVWYELPESHLLVTFDVEYCLNSDGSCNMEHGTVPDIETDDALGTVMEMIGVQQ
ncbi:S41 family peptidase [[Clostridium] symbiosum]|uniref:S41 family peptidase n=1 Tax=Clostridium symbiosum TaxID=1512 RepID=UPI001D06E046|nr:S41 family peptidase [[Clostridium] symbiosum]MCB6608901.1 peptidase [[Clostridium] symbiosum]MCB6930172.1 peptidase [[Clostridium] symbiosum]